MFSFEEFCLCCRCGGDLQQVSERLRCTGCQATYEIQAGIPVLHPHYEDDQQSRYFDCYQRLAKDDLEHPLEERREARHNALLHFIGPVRNKRVLDIGSSQALYLRHMDAAVRVAFDMALPYLKAIPKESGIIPICGDAECLPFKANFFDVIIISDILEHVLSPEQLIGGLRRMCGRGSRVIVHVPWEEPLESYRECKYEFSHMRTFNAYSFAQLWQGYHVTRVRGTYPTLDEPLLFKLQGRIPRRLYNLLVFLFFQTNVSQWEYQVRSRWIAELPKRERWLLRFYRPKFKIFELKPSQASVYSFVYRLLRLVSAVGDRFRKSKVEHASVGDASGTTSYSAEVNGRDVRNCRNS
jgi:2-polyprenyl-3-methyl-5-hydroxy-6-metoxy-1,4-benzoquinol methylase